MYRSPAAVCARHPLTPATAECTSCGEEICEQCGTWIALRFSCLRCAGRYRRRLHARGTATTASFVSVLLATLISIGRPTPETLPFVELKDSARERIFWQLVPADFDAERDAALAGLVLHAFDETCFEAPRLMDDN